MKYDFKAQKIARIICHYLPCCPREGINPRELMPPFTILAARLFLYYTLSLPTNAPKTKNHDRDELCKTKVIVYKSSSELFLINKKKRLIHQGSTVIWLKFVLLSLFFNIYMGKTNTKLEFLYIVESALKI